MPARCSAGEMRRSVCGLLLIPWTTIAQVLLVPGISQAGMGPSSSAIGTLEKGSPRALRGFPA